MVKRLTKFFDWWALGLLGKSPQELHKADSSVVLKAIDESLEQATVPQTPCWVMLGSSQMLVKNLNAVQKTASFGELVESLLPFEEAELTGEVVGNTLLAITNKDLDEIKGSIKSAGYSLRGIEFPISPTSHRIGFIRPSRVTSTIRSVAWLAVLLSFGLGVLVYQSSRLEQELIVLSQQHAGLANSASLTLEVPLARGTTGKNAKQILEDFAASLPKDTEVTQIQLGHESEIDYLLVDLESNNALETIRRISESENIKLVELISSITPAIGANRERFRIKIQTPLSGLSNGGAE